MASGILAFVLASILAVMTQCFRYLIDIRRTARSSQVLQQKMEDIRLLSWSQLSSISSNFTDPADTAGIYSGRIIQSSYSTWNGTTTATRVTLQVTWKGKSGRTLTNTLTTVVANGGLNKYIF